MDTENNPITAVVIPAYKAEKYISTVLAGIPRFVRNIIVVDDASPDGTADIVRACGDTRVQLISLSKNSGVGGATLAGYLKASELGAEIIVKLDSDNQMNPDYMLDLIAPIVNGKADYTKGNRFLHTRSLGVMPLIRRIGNFGLSFLNKVASGYWNIFDPTNGYTAISAAIMPMLDLNAVDRDYFFESSLLMELGLNRAVIQDVDIPARYAGEESHLSILDSLLRFPWKLLWGYLRRIFIQYFIRDFSVITLFLVFGVILLTFGLVFGIVEWIKSSNLGVPATTGTVMLATLPFILGVQLLLQAIVMDIQNVPTHPLTRQK